MIPEGVHGRRPGRPWASSPADTGVRPSTSLPGGIIAARPDAVDLRRRRELEQDAGHARVGGQLLQDRVDLVVGGVLGQPVVEALDADLGRRLLLVADVERRGGVVADQHGGEPGRLVALLDPRGDVALDLRAHVLRDRLAVDPLRRHWRGG